MKCHFVYKSYNNRKQHDELDGRHVASILWHETVSGLIVHLQNQVIFAPCLFLIAPHSYIFMEHLCVARRIPWTEELGELQSTGCKESDTTERLHFHFTMCFLAVDGD